MHGLLQKLLAKRGIESTKELSDEEKSQFDKWQSTLSGGDLTPPKIADFCSAQMSMIEAQWKNVDNSDQKNSRLVLIHSVYKAVRDLITEPETEREALEKFLSDMVQ